MSSAAQHPTARERHLAATEERARVHALERQERHAARRAHSRAVLPLLQPYEPHQFYAPVVEPISPRRAMDRQAAPGGIDPTGFSDGVV